MNYNTQATMNVLKISDPLCSILHTLQASEVAEKLYVG